MVARFITSNLNRIRKTYSISTIISRHNYDFTPLYVSPSFQLGDDDSATRVVNPSFMLHKRWHTGRRSGMTERGFSGLDLLLILALPPVKLLQVMYVEAPPLLLMRLILSPTWF